MPKSQRDGTPVNRSDAVREALAQRPKATSREIIETLGARGIKVSPTLIYYVRSRQRHARRSAKRAQVAAASAQAGPNPLELVIRLKDLAREVGGFKNLKQLVDLLAE